MMTGRKSAKSRVKTLMWTVPFFLVVYTFQAWFKGSNDRDYSSVVRSRKLLFNDSYEDELDDLQCIPLSIYDFPQDFFTKQQRADGGVIIHMLITAYLIAALAVVCDDYFVSSLELICDKLHLKTDVAGATFMAAGSSAPEFFTSIIGAFITEGDVGVGTIVGSAVFNILAVTSVCGLVATAAIPLEMWPIVRDCFAYLIAVISLILVMSDKQITWYEGLILVCLFCLYIILMYFNEPLERFFVSKSTEWTWCRYSAPEPDAEKSPLLGDSPEVYNRRHSHADSMVSGLSQSLIESNIVHERVVEREAEANEEIKQGHHHLFHLPQEGGMCKKIQWLIMWPANLLFFLTIPDCRRPFWERFYMATFIMAIAWLGVLSYVIVWMVTIIGYTLGIPDTIMGLTVLAVGTSLPEIVASVIVTREGLGNMAIGNNIGSNVFDILFCLGLPWLIKSLAFSESIKLQSGGLLYSSIMLLATIILFIIALWASSWRLNKTLGIAAAILYAIFLTFAILYELNVFGDVNLPSCPG